MQIKNQNNAKKEKNGDNSRIEDFFNFSCKEPKNLSHDTELCSKSISSQEPFRICPRRETFWAIGPLCALLPCLKPHRKSRYKSSFGIS